MADDNRISDEGLVSAMAAGDQDALATLNQRYGRALSAVADKILRDKADAEEVAAEFAAAGTAAEEVAAGFAPGGAVDVFAAPQLARSRQPPTASRALLVPVPIMMISFAGRRSRP